MTTQAKGRVERSIRYIRENFFAGREWTDLDDLNAQAIRWCDEVASNRNCPEDQTHSVQEIFEQEKPLLLPLPSNPYPTEDREEVRVGKTPYARYDLNDYSLPHGYVRRTLTVLATTHRVRILDGIQIIAEHPRSYDKGKQIENPEHIQDLVNFKRKAHQHAGQNRLTMAVPSSQEFLKQAMASKYSLRGIVKQLLLLLDGYGATELEAAIQEILLKKVYHPNAVRLSLDRRREARHQSLSVRLKLPDDQRLREQVVNPHSLNSYDELQSLKEETNDE